MDQSGQLSRDTTRQFQGKCQTWTRPKSLPRSLLLSLTFFYAQIKSVIMAATQKSSKKRPAAAQAGPTPKKAHFSKPLKSKDTTDKKRSRPVTLPIQDDNSGSDDELEELEGIEDDPELDEALVGDEMDMDMDVSGAPEQPKDPNGKLSGHLIISISST